MIIRIQLLRNIGQFDSVNAGASLPLARFTVVYSENGRGKTTLAAVLRSLATGDPIPIAERRRLAAQHSPHVVVDCSGGPTPAVFENNAWSRTLSDVVIFDDVFIDQNVHSGLRVHAYHRQNLHELILGAHAVTLSRQLEVLVERIENHNRELRIKERAIPAAARGPFAVDDFCALPARADIGEAIKEAERALAAAREQDAIRTTPPFESLSLPEFDLPAIERVLQRDLPTLELATLSRVQEHLSRLGEDGEGWVSDGMHRIPQGDGGSGVGTCPFCAQDLHESPVIEHYRAYFSDEYAALKNTVSEALMTVTGVHGGDVPAGFERAVRVAVERRQFWSQFCEVSEFALDTAAIVRAWRAAREALVLQLSAKQAAPLERTELSDENRVLVAAYDGCRTEITSINRRMAEANRAISVAKERVLTADARVLANDLTALKAVQARHEPATAKLCEEYLRELESKQRTEEERDQTKETLEQHRQAMFPQYQSAINVYLARFNAGFRLDSVIYANTRGGPTCTYNVLINSTPVPVGGGDPAPGAPSFRNTLSAGDRNTLALAFFFSSLEQDTALAKKVVVIDDPISSLDEHRALTTVQEICRLADRAGQVIVLSHSKPFLCRLWNGTDPTGCAALEVARDAAGSTLRAWNPDKDLLTEHDRRHTRLRDYIATGSGDLREVARHIRPHLEAFLRVACPEHFSPGSMLGPFIALCEQRVGTVGEILDPTSIQELRDLNEYARRYHHQGWETEPINDGELRGFVERALEFAR